MTCLEGGVGTEPGVAAALLVSAVVEGARLMSFAGMTSGKRVASE